MIKIYLNTRAFEHHYSEIDITHEMSEAELLVMGAKKVQIERFTNLKAVYRFGVGADNVPLDYLNKKGIPVYFPSEDMRNILYDSTANFTVYLIMHMNYCGFMGKVNEWEKHARNYIANKKLLVIGAGNIGKRVAEKMGAFMTVMTFDTRENVEGDSKRLIGSADYISLHIPMNPKNKDFVDKEKLLWMKEDVVLINTARGQLVNEEALYNRLTTTNMRAAFDVFWTEPYRRKLAELPREKFFMTPHTSNQTTDFIEGVFSEILKIAKEI